MARRSTKENPVVGLRLSGADKVAGTGGDLRRAAARSCRNEANTTLSPGNRPDGGQ